MKKIVSISILVTIISVFYINHPIKKGLSDGLHNLKPLEKINESIKLTETNRIKTIKPSMNQIEIKGHDELVREFNRLSDDEIAQLKNKFDEKIKNERYIEKANNGMLTYEEENQFELLMRKRESLALIRAERFALNLN